MMSSQNPLVDKINSVFNLNLSIPDSDAFLICMVILAIIMFVAGMILDKEA